MQQQKQLLPSVVTTFPDTHLAWGRGERPCPERTCTAVPLLPAPLGASLVCSLASSSCP